MLDVVLAVIDPITLGLIIGAGGGLLKSELVDRPKEARQRKLRATEIALSPFTGLQPQTQVQEADPFGQALGFGATGASIGQGIQAQAASEAVASEQSQALAKFTKAQAVLAKAQADTLKAQREATAAAPQLAVPPPAPVAGPQNFDPRTGQFGASNFENPAIQEARRLLASQPLVPAQTINSPTGLANNASVENPFAFLLRRN